MDDHANSETVATLLTQGYSVEYDGVAVFPSQPDTPCAYALLAKSQSHLVVWLRNVETGEEWKSDDCERTAFVKGEDRIPHATLMDYVACFGLGLSSLGDEQLTDITVDWLLPTGSSTTSTTTSTLVFGVHVRVLTRRWPTTFPFTLHRVYLPSAAKRLKTEASEYPTQLRVPDDVLWFWPDHEGWLCDYGYVRPTDGNSTRLEMQLLQRGTGLGKILVLAGRHQHVQGIRVRGGRQRLNTFFEWIVRQTSPPFLNSQKYVVVAINQWSYVECTFANFAKFGDRTAYVRMHDTFTIGQRFTLRKLEGLGHASVASRDFPGLQGTDEVTYALE